MCLLLSGNSCDNYSYSQAVELAKKDREFILREHVYEPAFESDKKGALISSILTTLVRLTGVGYGEGGEIDTWLGTKSLSELENIYLHLYVAHGGKIYTSTGHVRYTGYTPEDYIVPDGMSPVQYLQLLMTTSL